MNINWSGLNKSDLIRLHGEIISEFKKRQVLRTKSIVRDMGEYLVMDYFANTKGLPKLKLTPHSKNNVDAVSATGDRYSIRCTRTITTGGFYMQIFSQTILMRFSKRFDFLPLICIPEHRKQHNYDNLHDGITNLCLLADRLFLVTL